jgi:hypothetical protein
MTTALIIMVGVMAFSAVGLMFVAIVEFVMYMRQSRNQLQNPVVMAAPLYQPIPVVQQEGPAAEKAEERIEEPTPEPVPEEAEEMDENSVTFELAEAKRLTIKEAYDALKKQDKSYFDKVMNAAKELEMARIIEATYAVTIMQGRDNIGKLKIARGSVVLDCTVINPDLVKYNKENGKKIKSRPTRFRIKSQEELDAAIYTLSVANQTSLENRNLKKKVEAKETNS